MSRRRCPPGSSPDIFAPRWPGTPGAEGQSILWEQICTFVPPRAELIALLRGWGGLDMYWDAASGNRPPVWNGADLAAGDPDPLTLVGAPTAEVAPYQLEGGADVALEGHTGASYRRSLVPRDPAADAVIAMVVRHPPSPVANERYISSRNGVTGQGLLITGLNATQIWALVVSGGGTGTSTINITPGALNVIVMLWDSAARTVQLWSPGSTGVAGAVPAGVIVGGGIGLAADPNGLLPLGVGGGLIACAYLLGAGIAPAWAASAYARCWELTTWLTGLRPRQGRAGTTYARASSRCGYPAGLAGAMHLHSNGMPPAGAAEGLGADEQIVSVSPKNYAFAAGDLATHIAPGSDVGLVASLATEVGANLTALRAALPWASGVVVRVQNPTGGMLYQRLGNVIGGAPVTSWVSIRARVAAGAIRMGWQTAAGAYTNACNVATGYVRSSGAVLPGAATDRQCLELPAGADVYLILPCAGQGARVPDEVPSQAAFGVSSTVVQGVVTTAETPAALLGTVEIDVVPRTNGGAVPAVAEDLVRSGALAILRTDGAGNVTSNDGANTATAAVVEADGVQQTLRHAHGDRGLYVASATAENLTAYDGALSTALTIRGSCRAVRGFRVLRNPRWRRTP